jgi:hypothetical protein
MLFHCDHDLKVVPDIMEGISAREYLERQDLARVYQDGDTMNARLITHNCKGIDVGGLCVTRFGK